MAGAASGQSKEADSVPHVMSDCALLPAVIESSVPSFPWKAWTFVTSCCAHTAPRSVYTPMCRYVRPASPYGRRSGVTFCVAVLSADRQIGIRWSGDNVEEAENLSRSLDRVLDADALQGEVR